MLKKIIEETMKPIIRGVYKEAYDKGSDDTARRLYEVYKWGYENGLADGIAKSGIIELDDIEGIDECLSTLVDEKAKEVFK